MNPPLTWAAESLKLTPIWIGFYCVEQQPGASTVNYLSLQVSEPWKMTFLSRTDLEPGLELRELEI